MTDQAVTPVWDAVSQWISVTNPDLEYWWKLTGPHISYMMVAAGYTVEAQYNALLFHYHWIIPYLGPALRNDSRPNWKSLLGNEGSPIEYSWKWNTAKGKPDVRYCYASVRRIMSMGGRKQVAEEHLQELRSLICAVSGLDPDFPEDQERPFTSSHYTTATKDNFGELPEILHSYIYYFDIAPGKSVPDIKFYTPFAEWAGNLIDWMETRGRGKYAGEYLDVLEHLNQHRRLEDGKGAHIYISALIKNDGELYITSYLGAEAVDPLRQEEPRRRSDSR
ncbi:uncharacterized protein CDV56_106189 [Aspergillus thermomutatus]|uniref:Uncharacterized protein n=1 Tax=Aspergillus thermomutatus TaxID=41047 RepID=A0A397GY84_ASPTH|nr:uncharacterized protein CDV56_106189 [Aspergillus thermomutatus]RHZ54023.1 hypothetical protein CDV56_106189 [Aspergillus thermomutatus]